MIGERVTSGGTIVEKVMVAEGGEARIEREQTLTSRIWEELVREWPEVAGITKKLVVGEELGGEDRL